MTEVSFAKSILTTLDQRPSKISPDHIEDPRRYPAQNAYILPRMPKPPTKPSLSTTISGTIPSTTPPKTYTVTLTSSRNPPLSLVLPSLSPTTSIHNLKSSLSTEASIPVEKLKILWNKRPVPDSKIIKDFLGDGNTGDDGKLEFGIMVIGGAASVIPKAVEGQGEVVMGEAEAAVGGSGGAMAAPVAQGDSGLKVIESAEFWGDLEGFLMQRTRDEASSKKLLRVFKDGYEKRKAEF